MLHVCAFLNHALIFLHLAFAVMLPYFELSLGGGGGGGGVVLLVLLAFLSPVLSFVGVGVAGGQAMLSPSPRSGTALYILHPLVCNPGFSKEFCIPLAIHKG